MKRDRRRFRAFPLLILAAGLVMGGAVMLLWNAVLPEVTGVKPLSYWNAVGLLALCRLLFGNFGGRSHAGWTKRWPSADGEEFFFGPAQEQGEWRRKWRTMNEEDRIKFREAMRKRCGISPE